MNRKDIIRMALEAEVLSKYESPTGFCAEAALKFAALVASAEREACANAMARIVMTPTLTHGALVKLSDVVNAIRARGQA